MFAWAVSNLDAPSPLSRFRLSWTAVEWGQSLGGDDIYEMRVKRMRFVYKENLPAEWMRLTADQATHRFLGTLGASSSGGASTAIDDGKSTTTRAASRTLPRRRRGTRSGAGESERPKEEVLSNPDEELALPRVRRPKDRGPQRQDEDDDDLDRDRDRGRVRKRRRRRSSSPPPSPRARPFRGALSHAAGSRARRDAQDQPHMVLAVTREEATRSLPRACEGANMRCSGIRESSGRRTVRAQHHDGAQPHERVETDSGGLLARRGPWWTPQPHRRGVTLKRREASQPLRTPPPASKAAGRSGSEGGAAASARMAERESSPTRSRLGSPASKGAGRPGVEDRAATSTPEAWYAPDASRSEEPQ